MSPTAELNINDKMAKETGSVDGNTYALINNQNKLKENNAAL